MVFIFTIEHINMKIHPTFYHKCPEKLLGKTMGTKYIYVEYENDNKSNLYFAGGMRAVSHGSGFQCN